MPNNATIRPTFQDLTLLLTRELSQPSSSASRLISESEIERLGALLLQDALRVDASDIHLDPQQDGFWLRLRVDGELLDAHLLTPELGLRMTRHYKTMAGLDPSSSVRPQDARRSVRIGERNVDLRLAVAPAAWGEKLTIRLLDSERLQSDLAALGLNDERRDEIEEWMRRMSGLMLVVGPTGSGKSTTLYTILQRLRTRQRSVVTIEDPVEYKLNGITQIQIDPRRGLDFADAIRSVVRLDPDYLLVGEIRDPESAHAAMSVASGGRTLLSTLHSKDAVGAITALRHWGVSNHELAACVELVVAQRLVRRLCKNCARTELVGRTQRAWLVSLGVTTLERMSHPVGCEQCHHTGYAGRVGIFEVWRPCDELRSLLLSNADEATLRAKLAELGHDTLVTDAFSKAESGLTSLSEVITMPGVQAAARMTAPLERAAKMTNTAEVAAAATL